MEPKMVWKKYSYLIKQGNNFGKRFQNDFTVKKKKCIFRILSFGQKYVDYLSSRYFNIMPTNI